MEESKVKRKSQNKIYYNKNRKGKKTKCKVCDKLISLNYFSAHVKTLSHIVKAKYLLD